VFNGLPVREVTSIRENGGVFLATGAASDTVYVSRDRGQSWKAVDPGAPFEVTGTAMQGDPPYLISRHHGCSCRSQMLLPRTSTRIIFHSEGDADHVSINGTSVPGRS